MIISGVFAMARRDVPDNTVRDLLVTLFSAYETFGLSGDKLKLKMQGYLWAVEGRSPDLIETVVRDFVSGSLEREKSRRGKLPTSEEFGAQLRLREADRTGAVVTAEFTHAPAFGPLWSIKRFTLLLTGPIDPLPHPTAFIGRMIDQGGEAAERYRKEHRMNNGYPAVVMMHRDAEDARGCSVDKRMMAHLGLMEAVPVTGDAFGTWRAEHDRRGWPWLPDTGSMPVVYFPKGGPLALDAFAKVVAEGGRKS